MHTEEKCASCIHATNSAHGQPVILMLAFEGSANTVTNHSLTFWSGQKFNNTDRLICNMTFFRTGHNLDQKPNFQHDRLKSNYSCFDAFCQAKHDAGKMDVVPFLRKKLKQNNIFRKNGCFYSSCSLETKQFILDQT